MKGKGQILVKYTRETPAQSVLNDVFEELTSAGIKFVYKVPDDAQLFLRRQPHNYAAPWCFYGESILHGVPVERLAVIEEKKEEDWFTRLDALLGKACLDEELRAKVVEHFKKFKPEKG